MSVEQENIIDFIGTDSSGEVHLTVSDHLPWDKENKHLRMLQNKLNSYLRFIESGEINESYPSAKGKKVTIEIALKYEPIGDAPTFLNRCKQEIEEAGFNLTWKIINNN